MVLRVPLPCASEKSNYCSLVLMPLRNPLDKAKRHLYRTMEKMVKWRSVAHRYLMKMSDRMPPLPLPSCEWPLEDSRPATRELWRCKQTGIISMTLEWVVVRQGMFNVLPPIPDPMEKRLLWPSRGRRIPW